MSGMAGLAMICGVRASARVREGRDGGEVGRAKPYTYDGSEVPW